MMAAMKNKQILLASRPVGEPADANFRLVDADMPRPQDADVLIRTLYLSVDPYMRGRMNDRKSYIPPFAVNEVIKGGGIGEVVESRSPSLQPGDIVTGMLGWELYSVANAKELTKIDPKLKPVTTALGVLGMPGLTAYFGLLDIGRPTEGETVVVSGAAGAVGMTVCQIAKIKGCRVVGIAGSDEKNRYLEHELSVDKAVNYKDGDTFQALKNACPNGVDVYFDNVGGDISDAVLPLINKGARIPICGQISMYNLETIDVGPRVQPYLLVKSALMQGFIITDYASRFSEGINQLLRWYTEGKLKHAENIVEGFENAPRAFLGLFKGENLGKQLVKVDG
ncbi:MAG TPA: NADP-dependent oxidoreductase [Pyrinomonadaceae bacterium]|nr:NADP-dependent oxidoreductase [Pyrinomonadaceae bacterium]